MGGQAFLHPDPDGRPGLDVIRVPPETYFALRDKFSAVLQQFYRQVVTPAEAPEKEDYGDVDFLVCDPIQPSTESLAPDYHRELGKALGAHRSTHQGVSSSFAVPVLPNSTKYTQIDVHVCEAGILPWVVFKQSYGDLWQILGLMIRSWGLTATEEALYLRIQEIEVAAASRYSSMLFLTDSPEATLTFLGLDVKKYSEGFPTEHSIFEWVAESRLFAKSLFVANDAKSSDRQRLRKRPMYQRFVFDWLENAQPDDKADMDREGRADRAKFAREVLVYFGKLQEHDEMLAAHGKVSREKKLFDAAALAIPLEGEKKNLVLRGLKRWVQFEASPVSGKTTPVISATPVLDESKQPCWTTESNEADDILLQWIADNWEEIKVREKERVKSAYSDRKRIRKGGGEITLATA